MDRWLKECGGKGVGPLNLDKNASEEPPLNCKETWYTLFLE